MEEPTGSLLATFLTERDQPCPQCEYNLRNLQGTRCPECGEDLVLRVSALEPKQSLLIAGLIGLSAGAGLNGLLLIYFTIQEIIRPSMGGDIYQFFWVNAIGFAVEGLAVAIWISQWKKIRRLGPAPRWLLAICFCGFLTIADLVVFTKLIR